MYVCGICTNTEKYDCLVSGEAEEEVLRFLSDADHTLAEFKDRIQYYRELSLEISALDDVVLFDLFQLECHDIKHGLNELVQNLAMTLVKELAKKHMVENTRYLYNKLQPMCIPTCISVMPCHVRIVHVMCFRICAEYENFRTQALKVPEDTREMMDQIDFMQTVKSNLVREQWESVLKSLQCLTYLMDVYSFTPEEMQHNKTTLTWPQKLSPIFEENERIIEASKVQILYSTYIIPKERIKMICVAL